MVFYETQPGKSDDVIPSPNLLLLNVATLNVDKVNLLETHVCKYDALQLICLTEIGLKQEAINFCKIDGFDLSSYYCRTIHKSGGVGIWTESNCKSKSIDVAKFCVELDFEVCAVLCQVKHTDYIVINCYRSPTGDPNVFLRNIVKVLDYLYQPTISFILCGDFNFDSYKNTLYKSLCDILMCYNLNLVVKWPTRITDTSCTFIDQIYVDFDNDVTCFVIDNVISDHRSVFLCS